MKTFLIGGAVFAALLCAPSTGRGDTLRLKDGREVMGQYEGGSSRVVRFRSSAGLMEYDILNVSGVRISPPASSVSRDREERAIVIVFGPDEERIIRDWFSDRSNLRGLPPGLARRDSLPPGLARQVQRNGTLPPGLQRRVEPLPWDLERRLPRLVVGMERVVLGRDVLLMDSASATIVDILRAVF